MGEPEHEGWRDMSDRDLLSYAWAVLSKAERQLDKRDVVWAEVATAVGHLDRRLRNVDSSERESLDSAWADVEAALPECWWMDSVQVREYPVEIVNGDRSSITYWQAEARGPKHLSVSGRGSSPAAALHALATSLTRIGAAT